MAELRIPDRSDWLNCNHGHWDLRELCVVCAEQSVAQFRADLLRQVRETVDAIPDTFPRAPSGVKEPRSAITIKADIIAAISKLAETNQ